MRFRIQTKSTEPLLPLERPLFSSQKFELSPIRSETLDALSNVKLFKDDDSIVLEGVRKNGDLLEYASLRLRDSLTVVLEAVKNRGYALKFASLRLKDNEEVVFQAVQNYGFALQYAS